MAKARPGLPETFQLKVKPPAELGDYLDEDPPSAAVEILKRKNKEQSVATAERVAREEQDISKAVQNEENISEPQFRQGRRNIVSQDLEQGQRQRISSLDRNYRENKPAGRKTTPMRRARTQVNMGVKTEEAFKDIVSYVQQYTIQGDVKASEVFEALVSALNQAKQSIHFGDVPRRGAWGSPTARAFVDALERAFSRGIAEHYATRSNLKRLGNE